MTMRAWTTCISAMVISFILSGGCAWAAELPPGNELAGMNDSGVQLSRTRQYLEWQQTMQRIDSGREVSKVEDQTETAQTDTSKSVRFQLNDIVVDASNVLSKAEIQGITAPYIGKEVSIQELYAIVEKINALYSQKGYMTCRAYLAPQTIKGGIVHISIIEGKTGTVTVKGNDTTQENYVRDRVSIKEGTIANISDVNKDLLRFNATNDVQLRITMKAGETYGTTDYVITAYEPQKQVFGLFSDNAGSETSGLYRGGLFWQDRSLTGVRDSLMMTSVFSEGTKSFGVAYSFPINSNGTKVGLNYSTNSVHITDGPLEDLNVKGHSYAYGFSLTQPLMTTETVKSEIGLEYGYQNSKTDFMGMHWIDDTVKGWSVFFDQIDYGKTTIFYQKHAYRFGDYDDIMDNTRSFGKYYFNTLYQKAFPSGQMITARLDGQLSSTQYLPTAEQFYIGGMYSVRGYTESLLGGDSGVMGSFEYTIPLTSSRKTNAYVFLDGGRVWGESAYDDTLLVGTGFGIKTAIGDHMSINVGMGFPLIRTVNDEEQSRARVHFSFNSQF